MTGWPKNRCKNTSKCLVCKKSVARRRRGWKNECLSGSINSMCNRLSFWWKKRNILRNWDLRVHGKDTLMRHISTKKKKIKKRRIQIHEEWWDKPFARVFEINIADVEDMEHLQCKKSKLVSRREKKKNQKKKNTNTRGFVWKAQKWSFCWKWPSGWRWGTITGKRQSDSPGL